jgi:hypothetical protein
MLHRRYPRIPNPHFKNTKMKPVYNIHKKEQEDSQPTDGEMVDCSNKTACAAICRTF